MHPVNMGRLALSMPGPVPCTPAGIEALLAHYEIPVAGSRRVHPRPGHHARPPARAAAVAEAPDRQRGGDGRAHRRARLADYTRRAEIVVAAAGVPGILQPEHITPGCVVVGGGVRYEGRKLLPDVDERCEEVAGAITPRVGGVGPTTIAMLFRNAVEARRARAGAMTRRRPSPARASRAAACPLCGTPSPRRTRWRRAAWPSTARRPSRHCGRTLRRWRGLVRCRLPSSALVVVLVRPCVVACAVVLGSLAGCRWPDDDPPAADAATRRAGAGRCPRRSPWPTASSPSPTSRSSPSSRATAPASTSGPPPQLVLDAAAAKHGKKIAWKEVLAGPEGVRRDRRLAARGDRRHVPRVPDRHQGPAHHAGRRRHPQPQRRAAPAPRPLRVPAARCAGSRACRRR